MGIWILAPDSNGDCCECNGRTNPCTPCGPPSECVCRLMLPYNGLPSFTSFSDLVDHMDEYVIDCIMYTIPTIYGLNKFTTRTISVGSTIDIELDTDPIVDSSSGGSAVVNISMAAGPLQYDITSTGTDFVQITILDCNYIQVYQDSAAGSTLSGSFSIPDDAPYYVAISAYGIISSSTSASFQLTPNGTFVVNQTYGQWDDSGDTRTMPDCPRLLLPIGTETTDDWYTDQSEAAAVLSSIYVSNCIGYIAESALQTVDSFSASFGGGTLTLDGQATRDGPVPFVAMYGSITIVGSSSLSVAYSLTTTGVIDFSGISIIATLYDLEGNALDTQFVFYPTLSGTINFTIPYDGTYRIFCEGLGRYNAVTPASVTSVFTITSPGTLTANPVQALYDVGLDCPNYLECV